MAVDARCTGCGLCLGTCPERVLRPGPKRPVAMDGGCTACLACVEVCPVDAIAVMTRPSSFWHQDPARDGPDPGARTAVAR